MVIKHQFTLKFPFGASFNKDYKYLIYHEIIKKIKRLTCINIDGNCIDCKLAPSCIYYHISGENFTSYPGLMIERNFVEKKEISQGEIITINIFLFKELVKYEDYIISFFESNYFFEYFYQLLEHKKEVISKDNYSGKIRIITPIVECENIIKQLEYYNKNYNCDFSLDISLKCLNEKKIYDEFRYRFNDKLFNLSGLIGEFEVKNINRVFFEIGLGKTNFIGGGRAIESKN
ncbi:MAG: hypothetical protein ACOX4W_06540 [Bacilli bacterium]